MNSDPGIVETKAPSAQLVFQYVIASADMRFIERTERNVVLYQDADGEWMIRGEVSGCGPACNVDLSHIILEFLMSCEGQDTTEQECSAQVFSEKIGWTLIDRLQEIKPLLSEEDLLKKSLSCVMRSMGGEPTILIEADRCACYFSGCPLCLTISKMGLRRGKAPAHQLFQSLCETVAHRAHPTGAMVQLNVTVKDDHDLAVEIELAES
jgi:hypothetical protein